MLLALPMGVFAQNLKFGHINAQEIITVMPEFTKAQNDIQTLENNLLPNYRERRKNSTRNIRNSNKLSLRILFLPTSLKEDKRVAGYDAETRAIPTGCSTTNAESPK